MKYFCILCVTVMAWIAPPDDVWAWSYQGHGDIAVAALEQLPGSARSDYAEILLAGPWAKGNISWRAAAARAAAWPDRIRDLPLRKLFGQYGSGKVPAALQKYRKESTASWHFSNALFIDSSGRVLEAGPQSAGKSCPPAREGKLLEVWPNLFEAYQQVKDPRDKALVIAFILHLGADAYQPLHLMGSLDANCRHDRGGNGFCTMPLVGFQAGKRCKESLHYQWDQGFGVFAGDVEAVGRFRGDVRSLDPALHEVRQVAPSVYPTKVGGAESPVYANQSKRLVTRMTRLASEHLAATLVFLQRP